MKVAILGDICPIGRFAKAFERGELRDSIDQKLRNILNNIDIVIANMECPIVRKDCRAISKSGPNLGVVSNTVRALKELNILAVNLANNHVRDFGDCGVGTTLDLLQKEGIKYFGVGKTQLEASNPLVLEHNGIKIGVCGFADKEFNHSLEGKYSAFVDDYIFIKALLNLKSEVDFVVCLVHRGHYMYPLPSPNNFRLAHFLADIGVKIIVFQHSHIVGPIEIYNGSYILYGQGNFLFDYGDNVPQEWNRGVILLLDFSKAPQISAEVVPISQVPDKQKILLAEGALRKDILSKIKKTSEVVNRGYEEIQREWDKFIEDNRMLYISTFLLGGNSLLLKLIRKFRIDLWKFLTIRHKATINSFLKSCDNREIIEAIIDRELK